MTAPVSIAQLTDTHFGASWGAGDPAAALQAAVAAVRRLPARPDAVLLTGDLAEHGAADEYAQVSTLVAQIGAPVHVLAGNHDDRAALRASFGLPGSGAEPVQYALRLGSLRLVALDTVSPGRGEGELDTPRLRWLDATLAEDPETPTLLAMHHPPFGLGVPVWDAIGIDAAARAALAELLGHHPQVVRI
ncbi:MAG: metallophosphoesterase, partial [Solirubrobacteraceae bacterium]